MSFMNDFLLDVARKVVNDHADDNFAEGFEEATNIYMGVLSKNIGALLNQIKSGSYLSDREQFLLTRLTEIKYETEKELRDFRGSATTDGGRP